MRWGAADESVALADAALEHCSDRPRQSHREVAEAHLVLAWILKWRGSFDCARVHCDAAFEEFRRAGDTRWLPLLYSLISIIEFDSGNYAECETALTRGRDTVTSDAPTEALVDLLCSTASLTRLRGDIDETVRLLSLAERYAEGPETSRVAQNMARGLAAGGHHAECIASGLRAVATATHVGQPRLPTLHPRDPGERLYRPRGL